MKTNYLFFTLLTASIVANSQVGIGTTDPAPSSILELNSIDQGFLKPRMTTTQRLDISSPELGLEVYDKTTKSSWYYTGNGWAEISTVKFKDGDDPVDAVYPSGKVGIGVNDPTSKLEVRGSATNCTSTIVSTSTIDFSLSNLAATSNTDTAITLSGIKDGGAYTCVFTNTSSTGEVTFSSNGFTFVYVGTVDRTVGKKHIYNFVVVGNEVYVTMGKEN